MTKSSAGRICEGSKSISVIANRNHPVQHQLVLAKRLRDAVEA
jgi:hypothetical protein